MIEITFEINGEKIDPDQIGDVIKNTLFQNIKKLIINKIGSICDPITGEYPKIKVIGKNLDNLSFEMSGSPKLVSLIKKKLEKE